MQLAETVAFLKAQIEEGFGVPVTITRIEPLSQDIVLQVLENQTSNPVVGFSLTLQWRHLVLSTSWKNGHFPLGLFSTWRKNFQLSQDYYDCFKTKLGQMGYFLELRINNHECKTIADALSFENWNEVFVQTKGPFQVINDNGIIHEDAVVQPALAFWGLLMSFAGELTTNQTEVAEEGLPIEEQSIRYERSLLNRQTCIALKGTRCAVCGKVMEDQYGEIGKGFIEVHHLIPVSSYGMPRRINPAKDLVPLCPNCHAMIHKKKPPYTVEELREIMRKVKG